MNQTQWTVTDIPPQTGKLAVVTGANSGIGWHTALELARAGSEVVLTARSEAKGRDAVERIRRELPQARVRFETLDLANLPSVRAFAERVNREAKLDLLVNNAGVMSVPKRQLTHDAAHGALPTLRAATALDVASGSYVAPSRFFQLKGEPVLVGVPKPARDEAAARTLWDVSRKLTGVAFAGLS